MLLVADDFDEPAFCDTASSGREVFRLPSMLMLITGIIIGVAAALALWMWLRLRRKRARQKADQEQLNRKIQEDALDRALSNQLHQNKVTGAQAPMEIHYSGDQAARKNVEMIRLTEQSESITKEYLFRKDTVVYLGEEFGHPAIFYQVDGAHLIYCEIFPNDGQVYIRRYSQSGGYLVRKKRKFALEAEGIQLRSGDLVELQCGTLLLEFI